MAPVTRSDFSGSGSPINSPNGLELHPPFPIDIGTMCGLGKGVAPRPKLHSIPAPAGRQARHHYVFALQPGHLPWPPARHRDDALTAPRSGREPRRPVGARRPAVRRRCRGPASCWAPSHEARASERRSHEHDGEWKRNRHCQQAQQAAEPDRHSKNSLETNDSDS
jgi:hypothetical protein